MSQPSNQPFGQPTPPKKQNIWPIVIGVGVAGMLLLFGVCGVGAYVFVKNAQSMASKSGRRMDAATLAKLNWSPQKVDQITLDAPCAFGPGPDVSSQLPDQVRSMISSMRTYVGLGLPDNFVVQISVVAYVPAVVADLDGAVRGAVTETARRLGDLNPDYKSTPMEVNHLEGRRSLYKRAIEGETARFETLTVCKGNRLWQVQVIYFDPEMKALANRIFESVEIEF